MNNHRIRNFDIFSRVTIHDIHQVEVKLEYNLEELQKTNNYKIETYFFIPRSLQVEEFTYPREEFYGDLQNYIRFKTPNFSFRLILDPEFQGSPINALEKIHGDLSREKNHQAQVEMVNQAIKELKLLGTMVRARLRDFRYSVTRRLKALQQAPVNPDEWDELTRKLDGALERGIEVLNRVRQIRREYENRFPQQEELFKYFQILEEFISYLLEDELGGVFISARQCCGDNRDVEQIIQKFENFCRGEGELRKKKGFYLEKERQKDDIHEEKYVYFLNQFKKILSSVLYLEVTREQKKDAYTHAVGAIAAFTASVLYLVVTVFISRGFAIDSLPFIVMISLGYVFKDRIKDIIKLIFNPKVLSRFPDHITQLKDTATRDSASLGEIREKAFFTSRDEVDPVVQAYRDRTRPSSFLPEESPEEILVYQKEININTQAIMEIHSRTVNLTDIMRFNIRKYLLKMDDPEQSIHYFDENMGHLTTRTCQRTYHLNLILKYSKFRDRQEILKYERYRLVLNKWGIIRVEFIEQG